MSMDLVQMSRFIHRFGTFKTTEGLEIEVVITNVRAVFNRVDFLISPRIGSGEAWVASTRVKIKEVEG